MSPELRNVNSLNALLLPVAYSLFPVACCLLPVACCLFPVACCLFPVACCLFPIACCLLPVACCLLPVPYFCLLHASLLPLSALRSSDVVKRVPVALSSPLALRFIKFAPDHDLLVEAVQVAPITLEPLPRSLADQ
ncbi:MAG: hypothetical protein AB4426_12920 [Xenococcaceae cyanobacterium]